MATAEHKAKMQAKRARRATETSDYPREVKRNNGVLVWLLAGGFRESKSDAPGWRKSIWTKAQIAREARP